MDVKNAFNSPSRNDLAQAVYGLATLKPFQRFFHAEYSTESELLYYGNNGRLTGVIPSTAGVRQGSTLSTIYFCAFLQPVLETLAAEFPDVDISAYVDDMNLASEDPDQLTHAFLRLKELFEEKSLVIASKKCTWFGGTRNLQMPARLMDLEGRKRKSSNQNSGCLYWRRLIRERTSDRFTAKAQRHVPKTKTNGHKQYFLQIASKMRQRSSELPSTSP